MKVKRSGEFARVDWIRNRRIFPEELSELAGEAVFTFRASMAPELERAGCLANAHAVWSLWPGYLDDPVRRATAPMAHGPRDFAEPLAQLRARERRRPPALCGRS